MILANLRVTVKEVTATDVVLETEQGQPIRIPAQLLPDAKTGMSLYLAADGKPLVSTDTHAKDILNEMIR
ncbi:MAG: hypothetical protein HY422_01605 [Candidatus Komeilibacteria bacterium]|nr:hypothetical protein [Candidatus Komeilibacteria bacterium]